jgi:hypothetical protein
MMKALIFILLVASTVSFAKTKVAKTSKTKNMKLIALYKVAKLETPTTSDTAKEGSFYGVHSIGNGPRILKSE